MTSKALAAVALLAVSLTLAAGISRAETPAPGPDEANEAVPVAEASATSSGAAADEEYDPLFDDFEEEEEESLYPDPWERTNRKVFAFNRGFDRWLLYPAVRGYTFITPEILREGLRNAFRNINQTVVLVNDAIQLEWKDAGITLGAMLVNSTVGLGGLFEPAKHIGMPRHYSDFGQTLALSGAESGPYLIIPIAGPTTVRDGAGSLVDILLRPATWVFGVGTVIIIYRGGEGFVVLEEHYEAVRELERSSVDFYAVLHAAYSQDRMDKIWARRRDRWPESRGPIPIQPAAPPESTEEEE